MHHSRFHIAIVAALLLAFAAKTEPRYDPVGNLVSDGTFVYHYDAFNRLIQVNRLGTAQFSAGNRITGGTLGPLVVRLSYDGLGRLTSKEMPVAAGAPNSYREDYVYDGVRRVQEIVDLRHLLTVEPEGGEPGAAGLIIEGVVNQYKLVAASQPVEGESEGGSSGQGGGEVSGGGESGEGGSGPIQTLVQIITTQPSFPPQLWTEREYVWGPGDVDECVVQIDKNNQPMYVLQDANLNVMALADANGATVEQYTYDPYGSVRANESFATTALPTHAVNKIGHQGLFFDHFEASQTGQVLVPNAPGLYYNRNRHYNAVLGRFMQKDPNELGAPVVTIASNGEAIGEQLSQLNFHGPVRADSNFFAYVRASPIMRRDPTGLFDLLDTLDTWSIQAYITASGWISAHGTAASIAGGVAIALNMYALATSPDYLESFMAQPDAFSLLLADMHAAVSTGGSISGVVRNPAVLRRLIPAIGFKTGAEAEAFLFQVFGGRQQVRVSLNEGARVIDLITGPIAREAKVGYLSWSSKLLEQIRTGFKTVVVR